MSMQACLNEDRTWTMKEATTTHERGGQRPKSEERKRWVRDTPRQKPSRETRGGRYSNHDFSWC